MPTKAEIKKCTLDVALIGKRIKAARKEKQLTQEELAGLCDCTPTHICNIENNDIGTPTVSLDVSFIALHQTQEYADMTRIYHINLCDTVTVLFLLLNVSTKAKVVKTVYNVLLDRYDSITIGAVQSY